MRFFFSLALLSISFSALTQEVEIINTGMKSSFRGLSVVDEQVVWVSGSSGTVGRTVNGGRTWKWMKIKGYEDRDFRDIEAFDSFRAVIMAVAEPALILRTTDGGENWFKVYENNTPGMFLDAMSFWNDHAGIVIGDPIDGKFFIARTFDGGHTWKEIPFEYRPKADTGEACFAASGTNIGSLDRDESVFVSGGMKSRIFTRRGAKDLPIVQGTETRGANSIAIYDNQKKRGGKRMTVVGGDFLADSITLNNCFYTVNRGKTWLKPETPPNGYRSCVEYITRDMLITCGLNGVDFSRDGGKNWKAISTEGFHVCRRAKTGTAIFLAGSGGRIGILRNY